VWRLWSHQDAWFHLGQFDNGAKADYQIKRKGNGVYAFVIKGDVTIDGQALHERDGLGVWDAEKISLIANSQGAEVLLMDVPMSM